MRDIYSAVRCDTRIGRRDWTKTQTGPVRYQHLDDNICRCHMCHWDHPSETRADLVMRKTALMYFPGIRNDYAYSTVVILCGRPSYTFQFTTCIRGAEYQPVLRDRRNQMYDRSLECDILGDICMGVTFLAHISFWLAPPDSMGFRFFCNTVSGHEALREI